MPLRIALCSLLTLVLATGGLACSKPRPATPEAAYSHFVKDVALARSGEDVALLNDFDEPTRAALTARAAAASQASGNRIPADPVIQLLQGPPPSTPVSVQVRDQTDHRATLDVQVDAGESGSVVMVREEGGWRVHLELDGGR